MTGEQTGVGEKRNRGIADAIFWKLHANYLRNNQEEARRFAGMLSEYEPEKIREEIGEIHFKRYNVIQDNISRGLYGRIYFSGNTAPFIKTSYTPQEKTCKEKEFCDILVSTEGRKKLSELLQFSQSFSILREFELGEFGRVDLLVRSDRKVFPVEVKMGEAPNSLVSQIDRYRLALELDMVWGLYDEVEAVVLAERFTPYEAIELSRLSVKMVEHNGTIASMKVL